MRQHIIGPLGTIIIIVLSIGYASAAIVPPAVYSGELNTLINEAGTITTKHQSITTPNNTLGQEVNNAGSAGASTSATLISPSISATAGSTAHNYPLLEANASATFNLTYYFQILGPDGTVPLNLIAGGGGGSTSGSASTPGNAISGQLSISGANVVLFEQFVALGSQYPTSTSDFFQIDTTAMFTVNSLYKVSMSLDASVVADAFTIVGPVSNGVIRIGSINFDDEFDQAYKYSIEFSEGFGNPPLLPGTPEPSTWAMMLIGFAGVGAAARYKWRLNAGRSDV